MGSSSPAGSDLRRAFDATVLAHLEEHRASYPEAASLIDELERVVRAGGKRLRPLMCYWGFRAAGRAHGAAIVRAAASLELLHTFAIVHDDIMDASLERRGEPSLHARRGVDVAILAGDLALVLADALLAHSGFESEAVAAAWVPYARMRVEVIAGQLLDLELSSRVEVTEEEARRVAVLKSGRYSVDEPLAIGAALASGPPDLVAGLSAFASPLGEAFQLRDDLLGTFGRPEATGKPVDSDIREGKRNVLYAKTLASLQGPRRDWFVSHWGAGRALTQEEVEQLRALVESSGARAETEVLLDELTRRSLAALEALHLDPEVEDALAGLARAATSRDA